MQRYFLLGPTASGKTAVALALAPQLRAEILSMDSMLVYRGMDLGTAKPTAQEQAEVPHHLIDLVAPAEDFSVARWLEAALEVEEDLRQRQRNALYVGGTNLYLKALTAGLLAEPEIPESVRQAVRQQAEQPNGLQSLYAELQAVDSQSADKIHPHDAQRITRALEVFRATQRPLSAWQTAWKNQPLLAEPAVALAWPREVLRQRVGLRFDQMLEEGLLDEMRTIEAGGGFGRTAGRALGYRQLLPVLSGEQGLEEARERAVNGTRTYIRRQMTWLRSFSDLNWVSMCDDDDTPRPLAQVVADCLSALHAAGPEKPQEDSAND